MPYDAQMTSDLAYYAAKHRAFRAAMDAALVAAALRAPDTAQQAAYAAARPLGTLTADGAYLVYRGYVEATRGAVPVTRRWGPMSAATVERLLAQVRTHARLNPLEAA